MNVMIPSYEFVAGLRPAFRALLACAALVAAIPANAQEAFGSISGQVLNEATGAFLQGAQVTLVGTEQQTVTSRDGRFVFNRVPAGAARVRVTYPDLDVTDVSARVEPGTTTTLEVPLKSGHYQLEQMVVTSQREGNAASLTRQKTAPNLVNVISTDSFGNIADGNIGQFIQRLPGTHALVEEGEILGIGLRGMPPSQSMFMLDGSALPAALAGSQQSVSGDRTAPIDRVPAEFIKEIEVNKAPLPDRPVDGLGGNANLVTKSAFDFNQRVASYRAGWNLNTYRRSHDWTPIGSFTLMDTFGANRQLGVALSGSYSHTETSRDRVQVQRAEADDRVTQIRFLDDVYNTVRWGGSLKLEYRFNDDTRFGADFWYSRYKRDTDREAFQANDTGGRRIADYNVVSRAAIEAGATPRTTSGQTASVAPGFTSAFTEMLNANWITESLTEPRRGLQYKIGLNGATKIAGFNVSGQATFTPAVFDNWAYVYAAQLSGVGIAIDATDRERPTFTQSYGPTSIFLGGDMDRYALNTLHFYDRTEDDLSLAQIDAERSFGEINPITVKTGLMWTYRDRWQRTILPRWDLVGADRIAGFNSTTGRSDDGIARFLEGGGGAGYGLFRDYYRRHPRIDHDLIHPSFFANNAEWAARAASLIFAPPNTVKEETTAAYVMGTWRRGPWQVVGGVRFETTDVEAEGSLSNPLDPDATTIRVTRDYNTSLPSLHIRYDLRPNLVLRASYSTSQARPAIARLAPATTINPSTETISQSNTGLLPQHSDNFDLSGEYFFNPAGVFSVGLFRKDISDYIYNFGTVVPSGADNGFGGNFAGWTLNTQRNAGEAKVEGAEINYMQRLAFLPAPFDGLSAFANLTKLSSSGSFDNGATELPSFVPTTINAGLSYARQPFEARIAAKYQSEHIFVFNTNPFNQQWREDVWTIDLNFSYRVRPWLTVYCDITNLANRWPSIFNAGDANRIWISEVYGRRINLGISGRF